MKTLWAIHLVEYIKTEHETQGQDLWISHNNTGVTTEARIIYFQVEGTLR